MRVTWKVSSPPVMHCQPILGKDTDRCLDAVSPSHQEMLPRPVCLSPWVFKAIAGECRLLAHPCCSSPPSPFLNIGRIDLWLTEENFLTVTKVTAFVIPSGSHWILFQVIFWSNWEKIKVWENKCLRKSKFRMPVHTSLLQPVNYRVVSCCRPERCTFQSNLLQENIKDLISRWSATSKARVRLFCLEARRCSRRTFGQGPFVQASALCDISRQTQKLFGSLGQPTFPTTKTWPCMEET